MKLRGIALLTALGVLGLGATAPSASAEPVWNLDMHHNQTHFTPGGKSQYWFALNNVGDSASTEPITLKVTLPSGITRDSVQQGGPEPISQWSCPGSVGDKSFTCTSSQPILRHTPYRSLALSVNVASVAEPVLRTASATVSGGGAPEAPPDAGCAAGVSACTKEATPIDSEPAPFGIFAPSFLPDFFRPTE